MTSYFSFNKEYNANDIATAAAMEQLIRELNDPKNQGSPHRINEIQKQLQVLQRDESAWQVGLDFLQHQDALIRFYGALTLTIKINADW